jgi:hypothetical protein
MSDGITDYHRAIKYEKERQRATDSKLDKMCVVMPDNTQVPLAECQLLYSKKYDKTNDLALADLMSENDSVMLSMSELVKQLINKELI